MIRIRDAAVLALTKLRTRKARTIITVITASLLFGVLMFAVLLIGGVISSAKQFTSGGLSERYIVNVQYFNDPTNADTPEVQARAAELYTRLINDKKAEAKRLGIEYDPASELVPVQKDGNGGVYLDMSTSSARRAVAEYRKTLPSLQQKVASLAKSYSSTAVHTLTSSRIDGRATMMKDGREDFTGEAVSPAGANMGELSDGWSYLDQSIADAFLLEQKYLDAQKNVSDLPIIAPYSKVERALGLKPLPKTASQREQLDRIVYLREHAADATFTICQRNDVSSTQINEATRVAKEIERNKNNKEYQAPSLIYGLPDPASCAAATVKKDTRSAAEKQLTQKQQAFQRTFGDVVDPIQQKITFRVVGLTPDAFGIGDFSTVDALVSMIAGYSLQGGWVVPLGMYDKLPSKALYESYYPKDDSTPGLGQWPLSQEGQLVEFANAADAKNFSDKEGCSWDCGNGKPFLSYFGSNSVLIQQISDAAINVIGIAAIIVSSIAALILMGMVGRVIGDSRRETAVFRAIGARRSDIRAVYTIYTLFLSFLIAVSSLLIGFGVAYWLNSAFSSAATVRAQLTYIGVDSSLEFHLIGFWWQALLVLTGLVIVAGLVSMLLPLSRNLARSPIKDMRDDT